MMDNYLKYQTVTTAGTWQNILNSKLPNRKCKLIMNIQ